MSDPTETDPVYRGQSADEIIELLGLEPLPEEGGMWAQTWQSAAGTSIYALIRPGDFSALHRLEAAEIYHFHAGAPLHMLLLRPDGSVEEPRLGLDLASGERPQVVVEGGVWQGSETTGEWTLFGTTMAPPFDWDGFELGDRRQLSAEFPAAADRIRRLTRPD